MSIDTLRIGTRKSVLALWQSNFIAGLIRKIEPRIKISLITINTIGDSSQEQGLPLPEIGGKGLFTAELEQALYDNKIDLAVHSFKDLPTEMDKRLMVAAVPRRDSTKDVLITKNGEKLAELKQGAQVGTSSLRRSAQLKRLRPDLETISIRGNVDTRIKKVEEKNSPYSAAILARAGLARLGYEEKISEDLDILPAPAQGALAVQTRSADQPLIDLFSRLNHEESYLAVTAERAFLSGLAAGCSTPVAALALIQGEEVIFTGRVLSPDGSECIEVNGRAVKEEAAQLGRDMAGLAKERGAERLLSAYAEGK